MFPIPPAMPNPTPHLEAAADRRARQLAYFRRLADFGMRIAEIAAERVEQAHAAGGPPDATAIPTLDFARANRAVTLAVNAENRVLAGEQAPRAPASDRRRALLCDALRAATKAIPDPAARAALNRDIVERVEDTLVADPDAEIATVDHLCALADELHLAIDLATLSDELLGFVPNIVPFDPRLGDLPTDPFDDARRRP